MARIIDLKKNRPEVAKPHSGLVAVEQRRHLDEPMPWRPEPAVPSHLPAGRQADEKQAIETDKPEPKVISWSGELYHKPDLKVVLSVAFVLFALAALIQVWQKNIITTIFFGLLGVVVLLNSRAKSEIAEFEIDPLGVKAYGKFYGYRVIKSFWIEYEPSLGIKELSLQFKKWYLPYLKIPLAEQNPVQLRSVLLKFIPEIEHRDTFVEILSRKLGM